MNRTVRYNFILNQKEWNKLKPFLLICEIGFNPCGYGKDVLIQFETTYKECKQVNNLVYLLFGRSYVNEKIIDSLYV